MAEEQGVEREQKGPLASCPQGAGGGQAAGLMQMSVGGKRASRWCLSLGHSVQLPLQLEFGR